jgi:cell division septal protein FtsQ
MKPRQAFERFRSRAAEPKEETDLARIQDRKDRKRRRIRALLLAGFLSMGLILLFAFILRSPFWRVREVKIEGNRLVAESEIRGLLWGRIFREDKAKYLMGFYNMLIWPDELTAEDLRFIPELKAVSIEKDHWRHSITVRVTERGLIGIWCFARNATRSDCEWFDEEGTLVSRAPAVEGNLIPAVTDMAQNSKTTGAKILSPEFLPHLFSVLRVLTASGLSVKEVVLEDLDLQEIRAKTYEGPDLYFSLRFPSDTALAAIRSLRKDRAVDFGALQYVDFRVENRVYYK